MPAFRTVIAGLVSVTLSTVAVKAGPLSLQGAEERSETIARILERNNLRCGISGSFKGLSYREAPGDPWEGIDVDLCRAVAVSIFGLPAFSGVLKGGNIEFPENIILRSIDPKIDFKETTARDRMDLLAAGFIDILIRNTTNTSFRDSSHFSVGLGSRLEFGPTIYYDGQSIMVRIGDSIDSDSEYDLFFKISDARINERFDEAEELEEEYVRKFLPEKSICVEENTTSFFNITKFVRDAVFAGSDQPDIIQVSSAEEAINGFFTEDGKCSAYTGDLSGLIGAESAFNEDTFGPVLYLRNGNPVAPLSKEPLGPVSREGDPLWADIIEWTVYGLIRAEEEKITQQQALDLLYKYNQAHDNFGASGFSFERQQLDLNAQKELERIGGITPSTVSVADSFGLRRTWLIEIVAAVGNYGEIYERAFAFRKKGEDNDLNSERGLNKPWFDGGLLYSPPFSSR